MKKLFGRAFFALVALSAFAFTACDDDNDTVIGGVNYGDDHVIVNGKAELLDPTSIESGSYDATTQQGWFVVPTCSFDAGGTKTSTVYKFTFTSPQQLQLGTELSTLSLKLVAPDGTETSYTSGSAAVVDVDLEPRDQDIDVLFRDLKMGNTTFNGKVEINYNF